MLISRWNGVELVGKCEQARDKNRVGIGERERERDVRSMNKVKRVVTFDFPERSQKSDKGV